MEQEVHLKRLCNWQIRQFEMVFDKMKVSAQVKDIDEFMEEFQDQELMQQSLISDFNVLQREVWSFIRSRATRRRSATATRPSRSSSSSPSSRRSSSRRSKISSSCASSRSEPRFSRWSWTTKPCSTTFRAARFDSHLGLCPGTARSAYVQCR